MPWFCGARGCRTHSSPEHVCPGWRLASLKASVGKAERNDPNDVVIVQAGLNRVIGPAASGRLRTSGAFDDAVDDAIRRFQRIAIGLNPDGCVAPGGKTYRALADVLNLKRIVVSLVEQTLHALEDGRRVFAFPCVTGDGAHPTNAGTFRVLRKYDVYTSKKYGADMNWAMFFTHDGKAIHQYHGIAGLTAVRIMRHNVSDWFGSHGCVRLEEAHARALWNWAPVGTQIYVY